QIITQLLDPRFMADRRKPIRLAGWWFCRILTANPVNLIQILRFGVIRLQVLVRYWPGGRNSSVVSQFSKVLRSETHESGTIKLRITADEIMGTRHKFVSFHVSPRLNIVVPPFTHNRTRIPILLFTRNEIA